MIIGITGYIGSGKSTVAKLFVEKGFELIDVDGISHELLKSSEIRAKITAEFGEQILDRNLHIDRKRLSEIVFNDERKLKILNSIVHEPLKQMLHEQITQLRKNNVKAVVDVALVSELELTTLFDKLIIVKTTIENTYSRLTSRYSQLQIVTIMNNQAIPLDADYVIENNSSLESLQSKVANIIQDVGGTQ